MKTKRLYAIVLLSLLVTSCSSNTSSSIEASSESQSEETSTSTTEEKRMSRDDGEVICETYQNPVHVENKNNTNAYIGEIADPSIAREDDDLYIFATNKVVLHSKDGCNWKEKERVPAKLLWTKEEQPEYNYMLWAPDAVKINNRWYYYYSVSTGWNTPKFFEGVGYMSSDSLAGPWTNENKLFFGNDLSPKVENCIDPHIFVDDDGRIYCTVGSFIGSYIVELEEDNGTLSLVDGSATLIAGRPNHGWEGNQFEGHYIIKKDGYYYYFGSHGTCCWSQLGQGQSPRNLTYKVAVGKSKNILGPYVDEAGNLLLDSYGSSMYGTLTTIPDGENVFAPGHNSIFKDDYGEYWIYYHAYSTDDDLATRHLFMDKLYWDKKGFPYLRKDMNDYNGKDRKTDSVNIVGSFHQELEGPYIFNPYE